MPYSWVDEDQRANVCTEGGERLEKRPQRIKILGWLVKAHDALGTKEEPSTEEDSVARAKAGAAAVRPAADSGALSLPTDRGNA